MSTNRLGPLAKQVCSRVNLGQELVFWEGEALADIRRCYRELEQSSLEHAPDAPDAPDTLDAPDAPDIPDAPASLSASRAPAPSACVDKACF